MNTSILQPLLELLKVEDPADLTNEEIARFRNWLQDAYAAADGEAVEPVEITRQAALPEVRSPNMQPTAAHVDRVMQSLLSWEGRTRKRMGRMSWRPARGNRAATESMDTHS